MALPIAPELPSLDTFGGTFSDASSVVDAETELAATHYNALIAHVVGISKTVPKAWARVTISGGTPTLADHSAVWGDTVGVAPTLTDNAAGDITVTWAASYNDLRESPETAESHAVQVRAAQLSCKAATAINLSASYDLVSAVAVRCKFYDKTDALTDPAEFTLTVW
jgi:hypothetical protein